MKIEINGVDVTNDCIVKDDTIIFYGAKWPDTFTLPSVPAVSVKGDSREDMEKFESFHSLLKSKSIDGNVAVIEKK